MTPLERINVVCGEPENDSTNWALHLGAAMFLGVLVFTFLAHGAQDTRPLSRPATSQGLPLRAKISAVRGMVEVKLTEVAKWQAAKADMIVEEGGEFRTGPRSAVQFVIAPDQTITLDRLGTVKLVTLVQQLSGKVQTDLGMKYGRTRYDIATGGVEHESTIRSPNSTLAIRGTMVSLTDSRPFPVEAVSLTGRAEFNTFKKQVAFGGSGKAKINTQQGSAAATALASTIVDPSISNARDLAEQALVADLISRGSVVTLDPSTGLRIIKGGSVPTDNEIVNLLPDRLNFVLRWSANANLDLQVGNSLNETVYPAAGLTTSPSGGKTAFDHQGGPKGGIEIISWPANFPRLSYGVGVNHVSGAVTPANMQIYLNGQQFPITGFDANGLPTQSNSVDFTVAQFHPKSAGN